MEETLLTTTDMGGKAEVKVEPCPELDVTKCSISTNVTAAAKTGLFLGVVTATSAVVTYAAIAGVGWAQEKFCTWRAKKKAEELSKELDKELSETLGKKEGDN